LSRVLSLVQLHGGHDFLISQGILRTTYDGRTSADGLRQTDDGGYTGRREGDQDPVNQDHVGRTCSTSEPRLRRRDLTSSRVLEVTKGQNQLPRPTPSTI
jgi:hypothetical protein